VQYRITGTYRVRSPDLLNTYVIALKDMATGTRMRIALTLLALGVVTPLFAEDYRTPIYQVGVSLPLTGDLAEYGAAVRNGIEVARNKLPSEFKHLKLTFDDNQYDAKVALTVVQRFQSDKMDLVYSWGEVPLNAIAPVAEKNRLPLTAYSLDNSAARYSRYVTLMSNDPKSLTAPLVNILRKQQLKHFGVIAMEDPYIDACIQGFRSNLKEDESLTIVSTVLPAEADMKPHALRAKTASIDALGVYLYPGQISSLYRSLGAIGVTHRTFGTDIFESRREIRSAGSPMQGALYPNFEIPKWFADEYVRRFKDDAQISYGYNGYAWAVVAASVLSSSPDKLSADGIVAAFRSVKGDEGGLNFRPKLTLDGIHYYEFPVVVRKVLDGSFENFQEGELEKR